MVPLSSGSAADLREPMNPHKYRSGPRGATTAEGKKQNKIRKFQRLRDGFSRTFTVSTIRPQRFKVRLNCECVCFFANGFQFGTRTLLPGCCSPSTGSPLQLPAGSEADRAGRLQQTAAGARQGEEREGSSARTATHS